jgi:hypothetical protein
VLNTYGVSTPGTSNKRVCPFQELEVPFFQQMARAESGAHKAQASVPMTKKHPSAGLKMLRGRKIADRYPGRIWYCLRFLAPLQGFV